MGSHVLAVKCYTAQFVTRENIFWTVRRFSMLSATGTLLNTTTVYVLILVFTFRNLEYAIA